MITLTESLQESEHIPNSALYHLRTIWLVTVNDLKSIVIPETAFGICSALSGPTLTSNNLPNSLEILARIPTVLFWTWINVLIFDLANQRLPNSIIEDSINKAWRPIPSKRISATHARRLLLVVIPVVFAITLYIGGMEETVAMMVLTWQYNDLGGADENFVVRNIINAVGFVCYSSGATRVACGYGRCSLNQNAYLWLTIIGGIVFSTLQMQDMGTQASSLIRACTNEDAADQEGDRARGRRTMPLVIGDYPTRWSIALAVVLWSFICPAFWQLDIYVWMISMSFGGVIALRILLCRGIAEDKLTWLFWNIWITSLYLLPLIRYYYIRF